MASDRKNAGEAGRNAKANGNEKAATQAKSTNAQMKIAAEGGREEMKRDGARSVRYDGDSDELQIVLNSGVTIRIPRMRIPGLQKAAQGDLADIELSPMQTTISFIRLDADYSVQGLIKHVLGFNEQQRAAGSVTSAAKRVAAAQNGRRGGRPAKELLKSAAAR